MTKESVNSTNQKPLLRWFLLLWLGLVYVQSLQSQGLLDFIYGLGAGTKPGVMYSPQSNLVVFTILMMVHTGLHWLAFSLRKQRNLLLYFLGQGVLVLLICFIAHATDLIFYLCLALTIEAVVLLEQTRLLILVVGGCLLLFIFAEGVQIVPLTVASPSNSADKVSNALATGLTLILFVIACVMLYIQQRQAHQRDQTILNELETAHTQLKTTHDQLEATHRQLEEYANQVEDLTLITERQRLARELHDTLAQGLVGLTMQLETIDALLLKQRCEQARTIVQQTMTRARSTMAQARAAIEDLRADALDGQQFAQIVQTEVQRFTSATSIACTCSLPETLILPVAFHEHCLRLVTEGLINIAQHAQATRAWVRGTCDQDTFTLEISDNGVGFDPLAVAQQAGHYGLLGLRERARLLQGQLDIVSAPEQGTTIRLHFPGVKGEKKDE